MVTFPLVPLCLEDKHINLLASRILSSRPLLLDAISPRYFHRPCQGTEAYSRDPLRLDDRRPATQWLGYPGVN